MKKLLITLFIIQVVSSTLLYFYGVFSSDFGPIIVSWVVFGTFCLIIFYITKGFSLGFGSLSNSYFGRNKKRKLISKQDEDDTYQLVSDEVKNNTVKDAVWTKLYIKNNGDKQKTEIDYLKERVNQILDEKEKEKEQQALIEQERKKKGNAIGCLIIIIIFAVFIITLLNQ